MENEQKCPRAASNKEDIPGTGSLAPGMATTGPQMGCCHPHTPQISTVNSSIHGTWLMCFSKAGKSETRFLGFSNKNEGPVFLSKSHG